LLAIIPEIAPSSSKKRFFWTWFSQEDEFCTLKMSLGIHCFRVSLI